MSNAVVRTEWISPEEYLAAEETSEMRHEYVDGMVYAMSGGTRIHSRIATRILSFLAAQLKGKQCEPFGPDLKVRVRFPSGDCFYYPDVSVVCSKGEESDLFDDDPRVIFEVLSPSTRRIDEREKLQAYCSLPALQMYVMVDSERVAVKALSRSGDGWSTELLLDRGETLRLPAIDCAISLAEIYD